MITKKTKHNIFEYTIIYTIYIIFFCYLFYSKCVFASVVKCSDFFNQEKGNTALDGNIDSCTEYLPTVEVKDNGLQILSNDIVNNIVVDRDNNIPLYSPVRSIKLNTTPNVLTQDTYVAEFTNDELNRIINNVKLCGYDWNNYIYKNKDIQNNKNTTIWYPSFGAYSNSYKYNLEKIFNNVLSCYDYININRDDGIITLRDNALDCLSSSDKLNSSLCLDFKDTCFPLLAMYTDNRYCELGSCDTMRESARNFKNRFYREYFYDGKEFSIPVHANVIDSTYDDITFPIDDYKLNYVYNSGSGCFDPRLDSDKGYTGLEQRYYFKGNEAANYACDRFKYNGQACVDATGKKTYNENSKECAALYNLAKKCCENRRNGGVCIYTPYIFSLAVGASLSDNENIYKTIFNGVEYDYIFSSDGDIRNENNVTLCSIYNKNIGSNICELNFGRNKTILFQAYYGQLNENSEIIDFSSSTTNKICVRTANLYPYNFNLLNGTEIKDLYCDGYYTLCNNPNNETIDPINFLSWDIHYKNDYNKIWTTNTEDGSLIQTNAYGKTKNIYTFNVHCVESSNEPVDILASTTKQIGNNKFMPLVCTDFSKGSSQNSLSYNNLGEAILSLATDTKSINITAPTAECILESVKNMFLNIAGYSLCKDEDEQLNTEGLCGYDTFGPPISIRHEKYDAQYSGSKNAYEFLIGEKLADDFNIFYKIQNYMRNIIKVGLALAIVMSAIRMLISGDFDIFGMKKIKAIITWTIKLAIVIYFTMSDAWQSKFYNMLISATETAYNKVFQLSLLGYENYKTTLNHIQCDVTTEEENVKKAYARMCTVNDIKETYKNCVIYNQPGAYEYDIDDNIVYLNIKLWGASASEEIDNSLKQPGKGGYTYGTLDIKANLDKIENNKLYVYVGGMANTGCNLTTTEQQKYASCGEYFSCGGFNGGGSGAKGYYNRGNGGGGATDIRFKGGAWDNLESLNSRFMVAGGGGGMANTTQNEQKYSGGNGGGGNNNGNFVYSNFFDVMNSDNTEILERIPCFGDGGTLTSGGIGGNCSNICKTNNIFNQCISDAICATMEICLSNQICLRKCNSGDKCSTNSSYNVCRSSIVSDDCRFNSGIFGAGGNGREGYYGGSGGGGGYYGGGASSEIIQQTNINNYIGGAGGGSGYINTSIVQDGNGENGIWFGHGKVEICSIIGADVEPDAVDVIDVYDEKILIDNLPENIDNNSDEICQTYNEEYQEGIGTIKYKKCYSNCQSQEYSPEFNTSTIGNIIKYPQLNIINPSYIPEILPTNELLKISSEIIEENYESIILLNTYWKNCRYLVENGVQYSEKYDGCYFGDVKYPDGKEYLAIFDTLDCKLAHYFNLSTGNVGTIFWLVLFFFISSYLGIIFAFLLFCLLALIMLIVFKIFYIYLTNVISITFMIFVSPFTLPFMLFPRFKNIFDTWLSSLIGFCLQLIMVVSFTGFVLMSIDNLALGDAKYINHNENGRLPTLSCDANDGFSILCLLSQNTSPESTNTGNEFLNYLGITPMIMFFDYISDSKVGFLNMLVEILSFTVLAFILSELLDKIPELSQKVFSGPGMQKANLNYRKMTGLVTKYGGKVPYEMIRGASSIGMGVGREINRLRKDGFEKTWSRRMQPVKDFFHNNFTKEGRSNKFGIVKERQEDKLIKAAKKNMKNVYKK